MTLNENIEIATSEFNDAYLRGEYDEEPKDKIIGFLERKLREIATASLEACRVEERNQAWSDKGEDFNEAWNGAISEQKKKADEYLKP